MAGNAVHKGLVIASVAYLVIVGVFVFSERGVVPSPVVPEISREGIWLRIPSIGVNASMQSVGLTPKGNMGIPTNYTDVAWFTGSAKPGTAGTSIVVGHRDTHIFGPGVFRSLGQLAAGDDVYVTIDGKEAHFRVVGKRTYKEDTDRIEEITRGDGHTARLNLITCEGTWNQSVRRYDERLVVFTELVR